MLELKSVLLVSQRKGRLARPGNKGNNVGDNNKKGSTIEGKGNARNRLAGLQMKRTFAPDLPRADISGLVLILKLLRLAPFPLRWPMIYIRRSPRHGFPA